MNLAQRDQNSDFTQKKIISEQVKKGVKQANKTWKGIQYRE